MSFFFLSQRSVSQVYVLYIKNIHCDFFYGTACVSERKTYTSMEEALSFFPLPFMFPSTVTPPLLCPISGHYFQGSLTQSCLKMHLEVECFKKTLFSRASLLALPPLTTRKSSRLLFHITAAAPFPLQHLFQCSEWAWLPGGSQGQTERYGNILTCSRHTCETGLSAVKVLIRPVREKVRCNIATCLSQSIQQSFVSEEM